MMTARFLAITDRRIMGPDPIACARRFLERTPGALVQIREKDLDGRALFTWVRELLPTTRLLGAGLFVNGRADVVRCFAPEVGLHLPEDGMPIEAARQLLPEGTPISAAAHDLAGVERKLNAGATLVTLSPIFETPSKPGAMPLGMKTLLEIPAPVRPRVFALGGIDRARAEAIWTEGFGVAAIRSAWIE